MLVGVEDWLYFIKSGLKEKIIQDAKDMLILNEADLQCSISRHLRYFHTKEYADTSWHVHNEFRQRRKGSKETTYPDIQIFRKSQLMISMELKHYFGRPFSREKLIEDLEKLSTRGAQSPAVKSVLLFTCDLPLNEQRQAIENLTESAEDLFAPMQSFPEIVCINSYQEEGLDYKWQNKYRTSIEEWSQYGE